MTVNFEKLKFLLKLLFNKSNKIKQQRWIKNQLKVLRRLLKDKGKKNDCSIERTEEFLENIQDHFQISSSNLKWISETIFILQNDPTLATYEDKCVTKIQVRQDAPRITVSSALLVPSVGIPSV